MPGDAGQPISSRTLRVALASLVLLLSAYIQFTVSLRTPVQGTVRADAVKYVAYAWNLKHHHTFSRAPFWTATASQSPRPDKLTLPGYPLFLGLFLGDSVDPAFANRVTLAQAALGVATCLLTLLLAFRLLPLGFAVLAGLATAISPHLATIGTYLLTEALFAFLVAAALYACVRAIQPGSTWRTAALAGLLLGLASLVRPQMQLLPFLLLGLCLAVPRWRPRARMAVVGLLCFLALAIPWQLRNLGVERPRGEPDLLVTTIYHGGFPNLMYGNDPRTAGYAYRYDPAAAQHTASLSSALEYIGDGFKDEPLRYLGWYLVGKPVSFLSWDDPANAGDIFIYAVESSPYRSQPFFIGLHRLARWLHWPLTILALAAMFTAAWRPGLLTPDKDRQRGIRFLSLVLAYVLAMHAIGAPYPRYGIPFRPLVYLLAMAMLAALSGGLRRQWRARKLEGRRSD